MMTRITTLTKLFLRRFLFSLTGIFCLLFALAFWWVYFNPDQFTNETSYYIVVIGIFGIMVALFITVSIGREANKAIYYPLFIRLPYRTEYLASIFSASLIGVYLMQMIVALLSLYNGPHITLFWWIRIPFLWLPINALSIAITLHASMLVSFRESRIYVFASLLFVLLWSQPRHWLGTVLSQLINDINQGTLQAAHTLNLVLLGVFAMMFLGLAFFFFMQKDLQFQV